MEEYEQKDWQNEIEYYIVQPKESFRKRLRDFFRDLFGHEDLTTKEDKQISALLNWPENDFSGLFQEGGQICQINFSVVFRRFTRLEWFVGRFSKLAKQEFIADWLQTPNKEFDGRKPLDFLSDDGSFTKLQELIVRLESGTPL